VEIIHGLIAGRALPRRDLAHRGLPAASTIRISPVIVVNFVAMLHLAMAFVNHSRTTRV
jgi:hypothetical protein